MDFHLDVERSDLTDMYFVQAIGGVPMPPRSEEKIAQASGVPRQPLMRVALRVARNCREHTGHVEETDLDMIMRGEDIVTLHAAIIATTERWTADEQAFHGRRVVEVTREIREGLDQIWPEIIAKGGGS